VIALVLLAGIDALVGHLPTMTTRGRTLSLVGFGLVGSALIALVMTYTDKALRCFAGDPWALLSQGWGTAVLGIRERTGDGPALALLAGGVAWAGWWTWTGGRRGRPDGIGLQRIERGALTIPFVIGLTGFNSWSLIIPGGLVAALVWWHQSPRSSLPCRRD
jgi:hypothetical protein